MNYPRVNLLKKEEQRYQGAVSQRFILINLVVLPVLIIAILSAVKLIQYSSLQSDLKYSREMWVTLEPRLERYKEQQRQLNENKQVISILQGWQSSQTSIEGFLLDIQQSVPEEIQLSRISIRSEMANSVFHKVEDTDLNYHLTLQGVSQGDQAENQVINLRRDLLKKVNLSATFKSVKLTSMRKTGGNETDNLREFSLEGTSAEGSVR